MTVVGVDACKRGWFAVELATSGVSAALLGQLEDVAGAFPDATIVAVDIPIGLPSSGPRQADLSAKSELGRRSASVFLTPVRAALEAATHQRASELSRERTGKGVSAQAYALRNKIFEAEAFVASTSIDVREVHPELCFATLLGHPAQHPKTTWSGMVERRRVLEAAGITLDDVTDGGRAATDDVLDAAAAAWTARRIAQGQARSLPPTPEVDPATRLPMAIWC